MAVSQHTGMGAIPFTGGVAFRVWAPFASGVTVAGSFNNWDTNASPLTSEGNGYWSTDVAAAAVNDQYKFVITNAALPSVLWKNDPYALSMTNSAGNSIVCSIDYPWQANGYSTPSWNEMVRAAPLISRLVTCRVSTISARNFSA